MFRHNLPLAGSYHGKWSRFHRCKSGGEGGMSNGLGGSREELGMSINETLVDEVLVFVIYVW